MSRQERPLADLCDSCLRPYLEANSGPERDRALEELIASVVQPTVRRVIASRRRSGLAQTGNAEDDIASAVVVRLLHRLNAMLLFEEDAILKLDDYVAGLTQHTIYDVIRTRFPARMRLRSRLRYLLQHDARFAYWPRDEEAVCGLSGWSRDVPLAEPGVLTAGLPAKALDQTHPADALLAIFGAVGRPVTFEALQRAVATLWNITDHHSSEALTMLRSAAPSPGDQLEARQYLVAVWREVSLLPERQRVALLLNLRDPDGENALAQFVLTGASNFDDLAAAVGMPPESLSALWGDLPLADLKIAEMLSITRQQVINLRQSARRRLSHRLTRKATISQKGRI